MFKPTIAILLNSTYFIDNGGALVTWTHEVYHRLAHHWNVDIYAHDFGDEITVYNQVKVSPFRTAEAIHKLIQSREFKGLLKPLKRWLRTASARKAGRAIAKHRSALIHIHNDPEAVKCVRKYNTKAIIVLHMNNDHLIETETVLAKEAIQSSNYFAFCSEYLMNGALKKFPILKKKNCFVIGNGASQDTACDNRRTAKCNDPILLFIGRIVPNKGVHVLIEAFRYVLKEFPDARLRVVGGIDFGVSELDDYARRLRDIAEPYSAQIEFTGPVSHSETYGHYREATVFVCPSIWEEPLGMVNAEAMASGLPIVAFAKGGIPEIVGDAGILIQKTTPEALAEGICKVLKDPVLAGKMAKRGVKRVSIKYSWDVIAKKWNTNLSDMLEY